MDSPSGPGALGGAAEVPGTHVLTLRDVRCVPGGPAVFTGAVGPAAGPAVVPPEAAGLAGYQAGEQIGQSAMAALIAADVDGAAGKSMVQ
jgi:hypothetical protein